MTVSKGIASGLPMGALVGRAALMDAWAPGAHGNTFGGNPVTCAAARATLDVIEDERLPANAAARGVELLAGLRELAANHPNIVPAVRGRGLMVGVEMETGEMAGRLRQALLERHVIVSSAGPKGNVLRLAPPLIITAEHVRRFLTVYADALAALDGSG
jgi:4-aminobutyrate aminotransferase